MLTDTRLDGSSGLLTWFGAPPARTLVLTVGNVGTSAVKDPVFQVGTAHGVFAPQWEEQQWRGTLQPGGKARIKLPLELTAGAHGDYTVSLKYGGKVLAEQPWDVGRPWGVTLFWILVCLVVPAALFRAGMAVVDRVRPRRAGGIRHRGLRLPELPQRLPWRKSSGASGPTTRGVSGPKARRASGPKARRAAGPKNPEQAPPSARPCRGSFRTPVRARPVGSPHRTTTVRRVPLTPTTKGPT
ncbi:hypothetical protein SALBM311S_02637 [Streptomyces alboniger]